jgi:hypothetical protein
MDARRRNIKRADDSTEFYATLPLKGMGSAQVNSCFDLTKYEKKTSV